MSHHSALEKWWMEVGCVSPVLHVLDAYRALHLPLEALSHLDRERGSQQHSEQLRGNSGDCFLTAVPLQVAYLKRGVGLGLERQLLAQHQGLPKLPHYL